MMSFYDVAYDWLDILNGFLMSKNFNQKYIIILGNEVSFLRSKMEKIVYFRD